jgi:uncharacterized protein
MLGTIVNALAIVIGGILGVLLKKNIGEGYKDTIMKAIGLGVLIIGFKEALATENVLLLLIAVIFGSVIGEALELEKRLQGLGDFIQRRMGSSESTFTKGFVTASVVYCVGALAIIGSLQSGLLGDHTTLYTKSIIDGISSIIFASTLGIGVAFSAVAVFFYQGAITLLAGFVEPLMTESVVLEISSIGGLLIIGIAFNILEIRKIPVANMLPAIIVPVIAGVLGFL